VGAIVTFSPPSAAAPLITARGYLRRGASLLKIVVALGGDAVCIDGDAFSVNGLLIGVVSRADSVGRPLRPFRFCGLVAPGLAFVATGAPLSFDSRYFGPIPVSSLTVAVPVWTY
jgi:conjugative transfer signal peptidase TraF